MCGDDGARAINDIVDNSNQGFCIPGSNCIHFSDVAILLSF